MKDTSSTWSKIINLKSILIFVAILLIVGTFIWTGITSGGTPDPMDKNLTPGAAILNTAILVFREGLETILVLSAIISGLVKKKNDDWKPIAIGSGASFLATIATWFIVVAIISSVSASELNIQAATGLLANIVLLIIMNWFFHKVYWTGWINLHNKKKRKATDSKPDSPDKSTFWPLFIVGLTSVYREGFEVVLFLQNLRLQVGSIVVLQGALIGLGLTLIVGVLTFLAHTKLPYKKMLVFTGALLVVVLFVMTGETAQEMQQAGWIGTTNLDLNIPDWMGVWFSVFPTVQSLLAQVLAVIYVLGSYFAAQYLMKHPRKQKSQNSTPEISQV